MKGGLPVFTLARLLYEKFVYTGPGPSRSLKEIVYQIVSQEPGLRLSEIRHRIHFHGPGEPIHARLPSYTTVTPSGRWGAMVGITLSQLREDGRIIEKKGGWHVVETAD